MSGAPAYDVVVPTVGRRSLAALLDALGAGPGPWPERIVVVDDRSAPLDRLDLPRSAPDGLIVIRLGAQGPAAARNAGWRSGSAEWVAFLDDDVVPEPGWRQGLADDLACLDHSVGGSQGRLLVPLPRTRRPTDWERNVAGLERARWATADMTYRRAALAAVGGFDERFTRTDRDDADLGARVVAAGWSLVKGDRRTVHPVRPADRWVSVRIQAGNADDAIMRAIHGRRWREVTGIAAGRGARHAAITASAAAAVAGVVARRPGLALGAAALAAGGVAELAWARLAPGPRTADEVLTIAATSLVIPPAATWHWLRGWARLLTRRSAPCHAAEGSTTRPRSEPVGKSG